MHYFIGIRIKSYIGITSIIIKSDIISIKINVVPEFVRIRLNVTLVCMHHNYEILISYA